MTNAKRDQNNVPTLICASSTDGETIVAICSDPVVRGLCVEDASTGSDNGNNSGNASRDENNVTVLMAVSSVDGVTPIEVYANPLTNKILIDSN